MRVTPYSMSMPWRIWCYSFLPSNVQIMRNGSQFNCVMWRPYKQQHPVFLDWVSSWNVVNGNTAHVFLAMRIDQAHKHRVLHLYLSTIPFVSEPRLTSHIAPCLKPVLQKHQHSERLDNTWDQHHNNSLKAAT